MIQLSRVTQGYLDGLSRQGRLGRVVRMEDLEADPESGEARVRQHCERCGAEMMLSLSRAVRGQKYCSRPCMFPPQEDRFWDRIDFDGPIPERYPHLGPCWLWTGCVGSHGYGQMRWDGRDNLTHRVSWIIHFGPITDEVDVCHHCDNPPCCSPSHLFQGGARENAEDMVSKGRDRNGGLRGEQIGNHKLTEPEVVQIRTGYNVQHYSLAALARRFGVSYQQIGNIVSGKHWTHL